MSFNVTLRDGKWVMKGTVSYSRSSDLGQESGYTPFSCVADDGETGNGNDHLNLICNDFKKRGDTKIQVWRNFNPSWPGNSNFLYCVIYTSNNSGSNGQFSIQIS